MSDSLIDSLQAQLREQVLPWDKAHELAVEYAVQTVGAMRANFNAHAEEDPYETGHPEAMTPLETPDADDPAVQAMADVFIGMLNRRGLVRIDPA